MLFSKPLPAKFTPYFTGGPTSIYLRRTSKSLIRNSNLMRPLEITSTYIFYAAKKKKQLVATDFLRFFSSTLDGLRGEIEILIIDQNFHLATSLIPYPHRSSNVSRPKLPSELDSGVGDGARKKNCQRKNQISRKPLPKLLHLSYTSKGDIV